jgi:heme-degrading monooxygenase HmoA
MRRQLEALTCLISEQPIFVVGFGERREVKIMILRTWHGWTTAANACSYVEHFRGNVLPQLRSIAGFRGALLSRADRDGKMEFFVQTQWESMDAVRAFAGDDPSRAVVEPEAVAVLSSFDQVVRHYEILD